MIFFFLLLSGAVGFGLWKLTALWWVGLVAGPPAGYLIVILINSAHRSRRRFPPEDPDDPRGTVD